MAKNLKGWSEKLETWHVETLDPVLKKVRKQQFFPGSPSLWILHLKYLFFSNFFHILDQKKYLDSVFKGYVQLVPSIYTHLFRSLCELLLILWQFLLLKQLVPNYRLKVKLQLRTHPKISSEIILAWENGSQSHHIGQSLYLQIS